MKKGSPECCGCARVVAKGAIVKGGVVEAKVISSNLKGLHHPGVVTKKVYLFCDYAGANDVTGCVAYGDGITFAVTQTP